VEDTHTYGFVRKFLSVCDLKRSPSPNYWTEKLGPCLGTASRIGYGPKLKLRHFVLVLSNMELATGNKFAPTPTFGML